MKGIVVDIAISRGSGSTWANTSKKEIEINVRSKQAHRFVYPEDTKTVTIKAQGRNKGIFASFSNGIVTDESWTCCSDVSGPCHSDYEWENASIVTNASFRRPQEIASNAKWIWISNSRARSVWCKRTFGKFKCCI